MMIVLAGGVLVGAVTIYLAASVLPTAVERIGGEELYAWNMTVFLVGQVAAAMLTRPFCRGWGHGLATLRGSGCSRQVRWCAPWRPSPAVGGALAQAGAWRWAFALLAVPAVLLGAVALRVLHADTAPRRKDPTTPRVPVRSLVSVVAAAEALSVAGLTDSSALTVALVSAAVLALTGFVVVERRSPVRVPPASTYRSESAMRWVYLTMAVLAAGVAVETFLPLFGQRLGHLPPFVSGFYGAALSLSWAVVQIWSASMGGHVVTVMIVAGPAVWPCLT